MSEAERQLLVDMREHARLARRLVHGMEFETFRSDLRTRYAARYFLLVVGEAASRLSARGPGGPLPRSRGRGSSGCATSSRTITLASTSGWSIERSSTT